MQSNKYDKEFVLLQEIALKASNKYSTNIPDNSDKMKNIVEKFISTNKRIVYGGIAINNILPVKEQFYSKKEFPDWDFFSPDALNDAKNLADIFHKAGFTNAEAKSGFHYGTYKVYVDFFNVADITQLDYFYDKIKSHCIVKKNIHYAPADWLRMSLYLELSRPKGDVSRWEKLYPRLKLLNKYHPMKYSHCDIKYKRMRDEDYEVSKKIREILRNDKVIFFGSYADKLYSYYSKKKSMINKYKDYDVLSINPKNTIKKIEDKLKKYNLKIEFENSRGELIPDHYSVIYNGNILANIYKADACYSYNKIKVHNKTYNIATIFTILSLYLTFLYTDGEYYDLKKIKCTSNMLQDIYNRKKVNKGILKIYTVDCIGDQVTFEDILAEKKKAFKNIKKGDKEYDKWFLRYTPKENKVKTKKLTKKTKLVKTKKTKKSKKTKKK